MNQQPRNPRSYHLRKSEKVGEGLRRIAIGRADKALEGLRRAKAGDDPASEVHAVRKDLKKLRSVLRLAREGLGEKRSTRQDELYRDAGRELSGARDAEVMADTLEALIDQFGGDVPGEEKIAWRADLIVVRETATNGMNDDRAPIEDAIVRLEEGVENLRGKPVKVKRSQLLDGIALGYEQGRAAMATAQEDPTDENFHEWRKRAKDLWYQLRIIKKAWEPMVGEMIDCAHELTDYLGDHHDLVVLREDLGTRSIGTAEREELEAVIDRRQKELEKAAFALGERLYAEKPKAFRRRIKAYLRAWR
jgi:CHAD domain-containing protein